MQNWRSIIVTLAAIGAVYAMSHTPIPFISTSLLGDDGIRHQFSVGVLGIYPALFAFVGIELLALILPPLRAWRLGGLTGRRRLTQLAFAATALLAFYQSSQIVGVLATTTIGGQAFIEVPLRRFEIVGILTLMGGTALSLFAAAAITLWGIGNGVLLIMFAQLGQDLASVFTKYVTETQSNTPESNFVGVFLLIVAIAAVFYAVTHEPEAPARDGQGPLSLQTPGLPTSTLRVSLIYLFYLWPSLASLVPVGSLSRALGEGLVTVFFGVLGYRVFNSEKAIARDLQGEASLDASSSHSRRRFYYVLGALGCATLFTSMQASGAVLLGALEIEGVLILSAIVAEVRGQWSFSQRHPEYVCLIAMDNVHLAEVFRAQLARDGIETFVQGAFYRRQVFLLNPLVKLRLFVPKAAAQRGENILRLRERTGHYL